MTGILRWETHCRHIDPTRNHEVLAAILQALEANERNVPEGMDYFEFAAFEKRIHHLVDQMVARANSIHC